MAPKMLEAVSATLAAKGLMLKDGTADDASLIAAPSSMRNGTDTCDPEMRQTRKGYQWCFDMIFRVSVGADSGRVHAVAGTTEPKVAAAAQMKHVKARGRAKGKYPFREIKHRFDDLEACFSRLTKTTPHLHRLFPLSNLWMAQRQISAAQG